MSPTQFLLLYWALVVLQGAWQICQRRPNIAGVFYYPWHGASEKTHNLWTSVRACVRARVRWQAHWYYLFGYFTYRLSERSSTFSESRDIFGLWPKYKTKIILFEGPFLLRALLTHSFITYGIFCLQCTLWGHNFWLDWATDFRSSLYGRLRSSSKTELICIFALGPLISSQSGQVLFSKLCPMSWFCILEFAIANCPGERGVFSEI